jgi:PTS system nitrogen regulatory IIA component
MKLADLISQSAISADLTSSGKIEVLAELGGVLARVCEGASAEEITRILVERERLATTGIGDGVAIPHGKTEQLNQIKAAIGISRTGVPFDAVDGNSVHIFVALLAPLDSTGDHLKALARVSRLLKDPELRSSLLEARTPQEIYTTAIEADGKR